MSGRYSAWPTRFWEKTKRASDGCLVWTGASDTSGYGRTRDGAGALQCAHRVAYELERGPIPEGLEVDHLCRNRRCVEPSHLEPVTKRENGRRGLKGALTTHCIHGHEYVPENTYRYQGRRACRECYRARQRERYQATRRENP